MSSPPPPPPPIIPQKRPSIAGSQTSTSSKRRLTTHPLRQTSFPAADATPFTPSDAGSVVSAAAESTAGPVVGKKRGRPRKSAQGQAKAGGDGAGAPAESVAGSKKGAGARSGGRGGAEEQGEGGGAGSVVEGGDDDDEGDEFAGMDPDQIEAMNLEEVFNKRNEDESKLAQALNPTQFDRYSAFKRTKFQPKTLKRIVNQVVSQSVTHTPLVAMNLALKWFTGEIIELAVKVQEEMAEKWEVGLEKRLQREEIEKEEKKRKETEKTKQATATTTNSPTKDSKKPNGADVSSDKENKTKPPPSSSTPTSTTPPTSFSSSTINPTQQPPLRRPRPPPPEFTTVSSHANPHQGGLLPEHLVEAVRRYRTNGEGNGMGFSGLSQAGLGVRGGKVWTVESVGSGSMGMGFGVQGGERAGGRLFR
ncbi:MAG: hypothetical protein Q9160_003174 [Pyrenula sp. 1 TL-2023]